MRKILFPVIFTGILVAAPTFGASIEEIRNFVVGVTEDLPSKFSVKSYPPSIVMEGKLPEDILRYARFYWVMDNIEGVCNFIGQRSNIEMVDPVVSTFVAYPEMRDEHPNRDEYLRIFTMFDTSVEEVGEDVLCPSMYEMLGPNGTLMSKALKINGLLASDLRQKYEVRVEDGVLWSTRDYCERRFYLEPPSDQAWHDSVCEKAKQQKF